MAVLIEQINSSRVSVTSIVYNVKVQKRPLMGKQGFPESFVRSFTL